MRVQLTLQPANAELNLDDVSSVASLNSLNGPPKAERGGGMSVYVRAVPRVQRMVHFLKARKRIAHGECCKLPLVCARRERQGARGAGEGCADT